VQARERIQAAPHVADGLPLTEAALLFAAERHDGQLLPCDGVPFVKHPLEVASLLSAAGYGDEVVASGVLHDVLENTRTPAGELEERFGQRVAELVRAVSEDDSIADRRERKAALRQQVARARPRRRRSSPRTRFHARACSARSSPRAYPRTRRPPSWTTTGRASLAMLQWRMGRRHRLVEQLRAELDRL
jgi:hypothetical protein